MFLVSGCTVWGAVNPYLMYNKDQSLGNYERKQFRSCVCFDLQLPEKARYLKRKTFIMAVILVTAFRKRICTKQGKNEVYFMEVRITQGKGVS